MIGLIFSSESAIWIEANMKISRTVLERSFIEPNDDCNGCRLNLKEIVCIIQSIPSESMSI